MHSVYTCTAGNIIEWYSAFAYNGLPCCRAGDFLKPDEVTFAVMLRGYGAQDPPAWQQIDATLTRMKVDYGIDPSIG